jgi:ABC-2 type transport system permease protein
MNTIGHSQMSSSRLVAAYLGDIRFELTKMLRTPAFALPTLLFPAMFYLLFGVLMGSAKGNGAQALYSFAGMSVFGTMAPGLFGFGVSLAFEREYGLLVFKQALPMPPGAYLVARMAMAMIFASIISLLMIVLAKFLGNVPIGFVQGLEVYVIGVLGVLPFCAIGLCIGAFVSGQAAPAIVNLIYLPMAFLSGLWVPMPILPNAVQLLAPLWPAFHLVQLQLDTLGASSVGTFASHVASLAGFTIVFFAIAMRQLANGGLRIFGGASGARHTGFPLQRVLPRAVFFAGIALIVAGVMGGNVKNTARAAAAEGVNPTPAATADSPAGVPAPATVVIADFDASSAAAAYGVGWHAGGDDMRGGNSTATQRVVPGGAQDSRGALEVSGTVGEAIQYPFGGTAFFPVGPEPQSFMDYSGKRSLSFFARGDGRTYTVIFLAGLQVDAIPAMFTFDTGAEWKEVRIPLETTAILDLQRVRGIVIGSMGPAGNFRFSIDNVRLE